MDQTKIDAIKEIEGLEFTIVDCANRLSIDGIFSSSDAVLVKDMSWFMAKMIKDGVMDESEKEVYEVSEGDAENVRKASSLVLTSVIRMTYDGRVLALASRYQTILHNFARMTCNRDLSSLSESIEITLKTRDSFLSLVRQTQHLLADIGKVERSTKAAPRVANHMMKVIAKDLEGRR